MFAFLNLDTVFEGMRVFWVGFAMVSYATIVLTMRCKPKEHDEQPTYNPPQVRATYISLSNCTITGNTISGNTLSVNKLPVKDIVYQIGE